MDSSKRSKGPVPFQGIGTRLRRSRSRDHSGEEERSDFDMRSTMRAYELQSQQDPTLHSRALGVGTLERPKRLVAASPFNFNDSSFSTLQQQQQQQSLYSRSRPNLYEDSALLAHQYEDPQLLMNQRDPIYDVTNRRLGSAVRGNRSNYSDDSYNGYLDGVQTKTTVISASALYGNKTANANFNPGDYQAKCKTNESSSDSSTAKDSGFLPASKESTSGTSSGASSADIKPHPNGADHLHPESNLSQQQQLQQQSPQHHQHPLHHQSHGVDSLDRMANRPISGYVSSSTQSSSVMHTYANPFQDGTQQRPDSISYGDDTTSGPIIPDLSTLRPSQLLKNSYAGTGPVPPTLGPGNGQQNILTCLMDRLWAAPEEKRPDFVQPGEHHRCSWRLSTYSLAILVILLIVILSLMGVYRTNSVASSSNGHTLSGGKVPCIVVEDLDETRMPNQALAISPASHHQQLHSQQCYATLSRDPTSFTEVFPGRRPATLTLRLSAYSASSFWFVHSDPGTMGFMIKSPLGARFLLIGQRGGPPTLSNHELLQVYADGQSPLNGRSQRRDASILELDSVHYLDSGTWYFSVLSDTELPMTVVIKIARSVEQSSSASLSSSSSPSLPAHSRAIDAKSNCPSNCNSQGYCNNGLCECFPGFVGLDCANSLCPVLCNGRGHYVHGQCRCDPGWKGPECGTPQNHCEVNDCNGNGDCSDNGECHCRPGFKGEHCEQVDCQPFNCSGRGVCHDGQCHCRAGWTGSACEISDHRLVQFLPNCSGHGVFDLDTGKCVCSGAYFGQDCSETSCQLDCGTRGICTDGRCQCIDGWTGVACEKIACDARCSAHGKCLNGTCHCETGWMGKYCTLAGCPNGCSSHGRCVQSREHPHHDGRHFLAGSGSGNSFQQQQQQKQQLFQCECDDSWGGPDCSAAQETSCTDEIDNDGDGLIDCADSECCRHEQCQHQLMCITSPDPLDVLLRKSPSPPGASFFQKVSFLIDDGSVQSYAQREAYSAARVAVIRGQVVNKELKGLIGVRVSATSDPGFGFTLTRADGWFDILVNGGGIVTLQFQRNPFALIKRSMFVSWNGFSVIDSPIVMFSVPDNGQEFLGYLSRRSIAFTYFDHIFGFDYLDEMRKVQNQTGSATAGCHKHDYANTALPDIGNRQTDEMLGTSSCHKHEMCVVAETGSVHSRVRLGETDTSLIYHSEMTSGFGSILSIQLTAANVPKDLKFVLLKIIVEGAIYERVFEADPNIEYKFVWDKRNVYRQKVYGQVRAKVHVGYIYDGCGQIVWSISPATLQGFAMEIAEIGSWNLKIQHRYNPHSNIFQYGDGRTMTFDLRSQLDKLLAEPFAGMFMKSRTSNCATGTNDCGVELAETKYRSFSSLASSPDGSLFIGDSNLIRRIGYDGQTSVIYEFRDSGSNNKNARIDYQLAYSPIDNHLYISDPERLQIVRVPIIEPNEFGATAPPDPEVVVGTGQRCSPHDRQLCGDGRPGTEATLMFPKGLAFGLDGSLYFADGNLIRVFDSSGIVRTVAGEMLAAKRQSSSSGSTTSSTTTTKASMTSSSASPGASSTIDCGSARTAVQVKLHWPTSVAVSPLDGALFFADHEHIFRLNVADGMLTIIAGDSCLHHASQLYHFGSLAFDSTGLLYIADLSSENRVLALEPETNELRQIAGLSEPISFESTQKCSVERCSSLDGRNCTCLVQDSQSQSRPQAHAGQLPLTKKSGSLGTKFLQISALAVLADGQLVVADQGALQLIKIGGIVPTLNDQLEYNVLSPDGSPELFTFNQFGSHTSTQSLLSGRVLYTFHYSADSGKLHEVIDSVGARLRVRRDSSGAAQTLEHSPSGWQAGVVLNRAGLIERLGDQANRSVRFDYHTNGLLSSRLELSGETISYDYCPQTGVFTSLWSSTGGRPTELRRKTPGIGRGDQSLQVLLNDALVSDAHSAAASLPLGASGVSIQQQSRDEFILQIDSSRSKIRFNDSDRSTPITSNHLRRVLNGNGLVMRAGNSHLLLTTSPNSLGSSFNPLQARLFEGLSRVRLESANDKLLFDITVDYLPVTRGGRLEAIQKNVKINHEKGVHRLKIELDWKTQRAAYFANQSDSPFIYVQFDEHGRILQLVPAQRQRSSISLTYDPTGQLATWHSGQVTRTFSRDRLGRLVELRSGERFIRFAYRESDPMERLPISAVFPSGNKYHFDIDSHGRVRGITTPKGVKHEIDVLLVPGARLFHYCPPIVDATRAKLGTRQRCFEFTFDHLNRPVSAAFPYDHGKIVRRYGVRSSFSREFQKDFQKMFSLEENLRVDATIFANGFTERWFDRTNQRENRLIWSWQSREYSLLFKYHRNTGLLKHQTVQTSGYDRLSSATFSYRYDSQSRLKTIQAKVGATNLGQMELSYNRDSGAVELIGPFRYFDQTNNETLIGDGVGLFVRKLDGNTKIRYSSLSINDKEVARMDHVYDPSGLLQTTRTFARHVGKLRTANFTFDSDGQLLEVHGREHWRFVYDLNGNLVTFLYLGNRIEIDYDQADRVRAFGRGQESGGTPGSTPYVTDLRGFVVQRGDEQLAYNQLGQLVRASRSNRYWVEYAYDQRGRLTLRRDHSGNTTQFLYANPLKPYLVSHVVRGAADITTLLWDLRNEVLIGLQTPSNEMLYVFCDQTASPVLLFDGRGQPVKEVHRSPFGHVLFDSNPDHYLPIDFHGAILDPMTNLLHFSGGRVYDSLSGRWLTPDVTVLFKQNFIKNPKLIHLYRFACNDPTTPTINKHLIDDGDEDDGGNIDDNNDGSAQVWSSNEAVKQLNGHIIGHVNRAIGIDNELIREEFAAHLTTKRRRSSNSNSQVRSSSESEVESHYALLVDNTVQRLTSHYALIFGDNTDVHVSSQIQACHDWTSSKNSWPLIASSNAILPGFIIGLSSENRVEIRHSSASGVKGQLLADLIANSSLVGRQRRDSMEYFYFYRTGSAPKELRSGAYRLLNMTVDTHTDANSESFVDVLLYFESSAINVRFGRIDTTTVREAERDRIHQLARTYALQRRILAERQNLIQSRRGHPKWSESEKQFLTSATLDSAINLDRLPMTVTWLSDAEELYDDAASVRLVPAAESAKTVASTSLRQTASTASSSSSAGSSSDSLASLWHKRSRF